MPMIRSVFRTIRDQVAADHPPNRGYENLDQAEDDRIWMLTSMLMAGSIILRGLQHPHCLGQ